jgi:hypothetical protein
VNGDPSPEPRYQLSAHATLALNTRNIELSWVRECLEAPDRIEPDKLDPALRHALRRTDARGGRVLRVVYNPSVRPALVVTAFFDRSLKGTL